MEHSFLVTWFQSAEKEASTPHQSSYGHTTAGGTTAIQTPTLQDDVGTGVWERRHAYRAGVPRRLRIITPR